MCDLNSARPSPPRPASFRVDLTLRVRKAILTRSVRSTRKTLPAGSGVGHDGDAALAAAAAADARRHRPQPGGAALLAGLARLVVLGVLVDAPQVVHRTARQDVLHA